MLECTRATRYRILLDAFVRSTSVFNIGDTIIANLVPLSSARLKNWARVPDVSSRKNFSIGIPISIQAAKLSNKSSISSSSSFSNMITLYIDFCIIALREFVSRRSLIEISVARSFNSSSPFINFYAYVIKFSSDDKKWFLGEGDKSSFVQSFFRAWQELGDPWPSLSIHLSYKI